MTPEIHGHVTSVGREIRGDELTADAAAAATTLTVGDTADFNDEQAGSVYINGVVYDYDETGVNHTAGTLTLTSGLLAPAVTGDRVAAWNRTANDYVSEWVAILTDDLDGSSLSIPVSHELIDKLVREGADIRGLAGESVVARRDSSGQLEVARILGATPFPAMEYRPRSIRTRVNAQTIPDTADTDALFGTIEDENGITYDTGVFTMPRAGIAQAAFFVLFAASSVGRRTIRIQRDNGGGWEDMAIQSSPADVAVDGLSASMPFPVETGTTVRLLVFQNSGTVGGLDIQAGARAALYYLG